MSLDRTPSKLPNILYAIPFRPPIAPSGPTRTCRLQTFCTSRSVHPGLCYFPCESARPTPLKNRFAETPLATRAVRSLAESQPKEQHVKEILRKALKPALRHNVRALFGRRFYAGFARAGKGRNTCAYNILTAWRGAR